MWFEVVSALERTSRNRSWPQMQVRVSCGPANCQLSKKLRPSALLQHNDADWLPCLAGASMSEPSERVSAAPALLREFVHQSRSGAIVSVAIPG